MNANSETILKIIVENNENPCVYESELSSRRFVLPRSDGVGETTIAVTGCISKRDPWQGNRLLENRFDKQYLMTSMFVAPGDVCTVKPSMRAELLAKATKVAWHRAIEVDQDRDYEANTVLADFQLMDDNNKAIGSKYTVSFERKVMAIQPVKLYVGKRRDKHGVELYTLETSLQTKNASLETTSSKPFAYIHGENAQMIRHVLASGQERMFSVNSGFGFSVTEGIRDKEQVVWTSVPSLYMKQRADRPLVVVVGMNIHVDRSDGDKHDIEQFHYEQAKTASGGRARFAAKKNAAGKSAAKAKKTVDKQKKQDEYVLVMPGRERRKVRMDEGSRRRYVILHGERQELRHLRGRYRYE